MSQASSRSIQDSTAGYRLNSPLLFETLSKLPEEGYFQFLDLAPATPGLLHFFSQFHCRLYLPGCADDLWQLEIDPDELDATGKISETIASCLPLKNREPAQLDVILLWDILNYLPKPVLTGLIDYLLQFSKKSTVVHSYIHTRQSMPRTPGCYQFTADKGIHVEQNSDHLIASPAYYQEALHRLLRPFVVQRSILLANGLQEYVFYVPDTRTQR